MPRQGAVNSNRTTFRRHPAEKSVSKIILTLCHTCTHTHFLKRNEINLLSIHALVKYKKFLMDLQLTLVTDSLLAAGMITHSLANTRRLWCLQCAIPEMWYFSMLPKIRSSDLLSSHLSSKTTGQSWEPANWRPISAENLVWIGVTRVTDRFWKATLSCGCWALGKLSLHLRLSDLGFFSIWTVKWTLPTSCFRGVGCLDRILSEWESKSQIDGRTD